MDVKRKGEPTADDGIGICLSSTGQVSAMDMEPVRIITLHNNIVALKEDAIKQICQQFGSEENTESKRPLVILSVVGQRNSGKSFLLNLLLHYLRSKGDGNWMNTFNNKKVFASGFYAKNLSNRKNTGSENGIYAWPKLLTHNDENTGSTFSVLLLDAQAESVEDWDAIEKLCCLLSSVIIDNRMVTFNEQLLENFRQVSSFLETMKHEDVKHRLESIKLFENRPPELCNCFNFVIRDFGQSSQYPWGKEDKAHEFVKNAVTKACPSLLSVFEHFEKIAGFFLLKPPDNGSIQLDGDKLKIDSKLSNQLKSMCRKILDESLVAKYFSSGERLEESMKLSVEIINLYYFMRQRPSAFLTSPSVSKETGQTIHLVPTPDVDQKMEDASITLPTNLQTSRKTSEFERSTSSSQILTSEVLSRPTNKYDDCDPLKIFDSSKRLPQKHSVIPSIPEKSFPLTLSKVNEETITTEMKWSPQHSNMPTKACRQHTNDEYSPAPQVVPNTISVCQDLRKPDPRNGTQSKSIYRHCGLTPMMKEDVESQSHHNNITRNQKQLPSSDTSNSKSSNENSACQTATLPVYKLPAAAKVTSDENETIPITQKSPPLLLTAEQLDDKVMPKVVELREAYKGKMERTDNIDAAHIRYLREATTELKHFLDDKIQSQKRKQELINQMEVSIARVFEKIKNEKTKTKEQRPKEDANDGVQISTRNCSSAANHKITESSNLSTELQENLHMNENDIPVLKTKKSQSPTSLDLMNCAAKADETPTAMETDLDDDELSNNRNGHEQMDTDDSLQVQRIWIDGRARLASPQVVKEPWIDGVRNAYINEMRNSLSRSFVNNLFFTSENLHQSHFESVKQINKGLGQILKKCNWSKGIPQELQGNKQQADVDDFLVNTEILKDLNLEMESKNMDRKVQLGDFTKQYQDKLQLQLQSWITQLTDLGARRQHKVCTPYEFMNQTLTNCWTYSMDRSLRLLLEKYIRESKDFNIYKESLTHYEQCFKLYWQDMEKKFEMNRSFSDLKFTETEKTAYDSALKAFKCPDSGAIRLVIIGLHNFKDQYKERNKRIQQAETEFMGRLVPQILPFYREMMAELTKDKFFMPEKLRDIHLLVVRTVQDSFWKSCDFKPNQEIPKWSVTSTLEPQLETHFQTFVNTNKMRAEKVRIEIKCLLNEHRTMYNRAMDELLPTSGPSRIEKELEKQHNENLIKICKSLETKITEMEVKIPHEEHVSTLKGNIEQDWVELQKLNSRLKENDINDAIRRREEDRLKVELQNEAKKQEAVKALEESNNRKQEKMTEQTETIVASFPPPSSSNPSPAKQCSPAIDKELPELFPIAIEFGFTLVRLGWMVDGQFELINNNWGEETTPTFIAVKEDGEIKIGVEANDETEKISLQDFFTEKNTCGTCYVDKSIQNVLPEILVALFLARLKSDVEGQKKGRWTTTVITVPLCFTSVQRQSMKDAAYLAGFESTKLINDTTAAAFCFSKTDKFNPKKMLLVGVAQTHTSHFDAALYEWEQCGATGLKLISHSSCGNLHASFQVNGGLIKGVKAFVNRLDRWWNSIEVNHVREMVKGLVGENKTATTASVCVNYKFDEAFDNIINRYGRAVPHEDAQYYIIKGAAMFSRNSIPSCGSKKVSIKDRASYSFLRTSHSSRSSRTPMSVIYEYQTLSAPKTPSEPTITTIGSLSGSDMQITICESSHDKQHHVGYLVVKTSCADNPRQYVRVKFTLSDEGIFDVENAYLASDIGTSSKQDIPFEWMSPNILRSQLDKFRAQVASMVKDEKKEAFENSKKELRTLIEEIKSKIDGVKSMIRKQILEEGIESANVILSHKNTTHEQLEKKIKFLQGLQSKYGLH